MLLLSHVVQKVTLLARYMVDPKIHCLLSVGGTEIRDQAKALKDGVHVVVGTPGRIEDLMKTGKLSCQRIRHFVLDEADRWERRDRELVGGARRDDDEFAGCWRQEISLPL